jgi:hypothetical protein
VSSLVFEHAAPVSNAFDLVVMLVVSYLAGCLGSLTASPYFPEEEPAHSIRVRNRAGSLGRASADEPNAGNAKPRRLAGLREEADNADYLST